jgi:hypothetical protein
MGGAFYLSRSIEQWGRVNLTVSFIRVFLGLITLLGVLDVEWEGSKKSSSKAAALGMREAYFSYVSTGKGRERCWWLFSTFSIFKSEPTHHSALDRLAQRVFLVPVV